VFYVTKIYFTSYRTKMCLLKPKFRADYHRNFQEESLGESFDKICDKSTAKSVDFVAKSA